MKLLLMDARLLVLEEPDHDFSLLNGAWSFTGLILYRVVNLFVMRFGMWEYCLLKEAIYRIGKTIT